MPQIKFTRTGANAQVGNFAPGDVLRCGEATARHLVEVARVAVYASPPPAAPAALVQVPAPSLATPRKRRNSKAAP
jgi:hypothetical protein